MTEDFAVRLLPKYMVNQTVLQKNTSLLLNHAISTLTPDVFLHPVWLRFGTNELSNVHKVEELLEAAKSLQTNDPSGACQILLLCAVHQCYTGKNEHALATVQDALSIAKSYSLFNEILWALWGACAVSFQQGKQEQTVNYLGYLGKELLLRNEWVLADFVEIVKQPLITKKESDEKRSILLHDQPLQDLLILTFEWLRKWGYFSQVIQAVYPPPSLQPVHHAIRKTNPVPSFFSHIYWKGRLDSLLHILTERKKRTSQKANPVSKSSIFQFVKEDVYQIGMVSEQVKPGINIVVQMLGRFTISIQDTSVKLTTTRGLSVFKYLLLHHKQSIPREMLMDIFWPDVDPDAARNNLNVALHALRKELRSTISTTVVCHEHGAYCLSSDLKVWLDVEEFEKCIKTGKQCESNNNITIAIAEYETAISLYQGDFLTDDPYEDWTVLRREHLRVVYLDTIDRLSQIYFSQERYMQCITLCQLILSHDLCREDAHCLLMRCYSRQGQVPLAVRQYQICVEALQDELAVDPAPNTIQLYKRVRRHEQI